MINLMGFASPVKSYGPGDRLVMWVQGCVRACPGCDAQQLQSHKNRFLKTAAQVHDIITVARANHDFEGISISGGEPFMQASELTELARLCRADGLTVMVYTGYTRDELADVENSALLLAQTDILVDGAFDVNNVEDSRNWVGSRNQVYHYLTSAYDSGLELVQKQGGGYWRCASDASIEKTFVTPRS